MSSVSLQFSPISGASGFTERTRAANSFQKACVSGVSACPGPGPSSTR